MSSSSALRRRRKLTIECPCAEEVTSMTLHSSLVAIIVTNLQSRDNTLDSSNAIEKGRSLSSLLCLYGRFL
jgi:hypothetical protein